MKYLITFNYKNIANELDNTVIETKNPLSDLRKLLPEYNISKGNSWDWNIMLWNKDSNKHLYYKLT